MVSRLWINPTWALTYSLRFCRRSRTQPRLHCSLKFENFTPGRAANTRKKREKAELSLGFSSSAPLIALKRFPSRVHARARLLLRACVRVRAPLFELNKVIPPSPSASLPLSPSPLLPFSVFLKKTLSPAERGREGESERALQFRARIMLHAAESAKEGGMRSWMSEAAAADRESRRTGNCCVKRRSVARITASSATNSNLWKRRLRRLLLLLRPQ